MSAQALLSVLILGLVNWIATVVLVDGFVFEGTRNRVKTWGASIEAKASDRWKWIGKKLDYLPTCPLCMGVWVGVLQAWFAGVYVQLPQAAGWVNFAVSALAYKAVGHLLLQVNSMFHYGIELVRHTSSVKKRQAKLLDTQIKPAEVHPVDRLAPSLLSAPSCSPGRNCVAPGELASKG